MYIAADSLDDLMNEVFVTLLKCPFNIKATRGTMSEIIGVMLCLKNPRARLSRTETKGKPFSALGEFLWYMSTSNKLEFIKYYLSKYEQEVDRSGDDFIYGGYGPRLFKMHNKFNQVENVIKLLSNKQSSRRAAIQLFDAEDIQDKHQDVPCTCTLQFLIRDKHLHMVTYMRSNDAFFGLPHDIFSFTMLQEIIARTLNIEVGEYRHSVGSLHLYSGKKKLAEQYINEGFQTTKSFMPDMPKGDPWQSLKVVQVIEEKIRLTKQIDLSSYNLDPYWNDMCLMLYAYSFFDGKKHRKELTTIVEQFSSPVYKIFIEKKLSS